MSSDPKQRLDDLTASLRGTRGELDDLRSARIGARLEAAIDDDVAQRGVPQRTRGQGRGRMVVGLVAAAAIAALAALSLRSPQTAGVPSSAPAPGPFDVLISAHSRVEQLQRTIDPTQPRLAVAADQRAQATLGSAQRTLNLQGPGELILVVDTMARPVVSVVSPLILGDWLVPGELRTGGLTLRVESAMFAVANGANEASAV